MAFFNFWWLIFRPKLLWNIEWIQNKVSIEALSCFVTTNFSSKSIKICVLKSKKRRCDTPLPFECHVLFEWPHITRNLLIVNRMRNVSVNGSRRKRKKENPFETAFILQRPNLLKFTHQAKTENPSVLMEKDLSSRPPSLNRQDESRYRD